MLLVVCMPLTRLDATTFCGSTILVILIKLGLIFKTVAIEEINFSVLMVAFVLNIE